MSWVTGHKPRFRNRECVHLGDHPDTNGQRVLVPSFLGDELALCSPTLFNDLLPWIAYQVQEIIYGYFWVYRFWFVLTIY